MPVCRVVIQQCLKATLRLPSSAEDFDNPTGEELKIGSGIVVYVCFLEGAKDNDVNKVAKAVANARLCENEAGKHNTSVLDAFGDILVIPQACLGGTLKGKVVQYHGNLNKATGEELYKQFVAALTDLVSAHEKTNNTNNKKARVFHGVFGARQVLCMETNGPFTHIIDF